MKNMTISPVFSRPNLLFLLGLTVLIFGLLSLSGNLTVGPRMADENQIFKQQFEFEEFGFTGTLGKELSSRFDMKRLVPVYCTQKVVGSKIFGTNMFLWSIYAGLLSVISGFLIFYAGRLLNLDYISSVFLSLVAIIGEQSVLWWRILQGESIGLLFFSLSLAMMLIGVLKRKKYLEYLSLLPLVLAALSKESFILMIPSVVLLRIAYPIFFNYKFELKRALKKNALFILANVLITIALIGIIKYGLGTTSFQYSGWKGFDAGLFGVTLSQFAEITNLKFFVAFPILFFVFLKLGAKASGVRKKQISRKIILAFLLFLSISLPQFLLYHSSGFFNRGSEADLTRYIIPCMLGFSFLVAIFMDITNRYVSGKYYGLALALIVIIHLFDKSKDAYQAAVAYGQHTANISTWFEDVSNNVPKDENLVIVFLNGAQGGYSLQAALRVFYIMKKGYGFEKIFFKPYPEQPTIQEQYPTIVQEDTKYFSQRMETVDEIIGKEQLGGVMILNWGNTPTENQATTAQQLERVFLQGNQAWFDPGKYQRLLNDNGHISYYIK